MFRIIEKSQDYPLGGFEYDARAPFVGAFVIRYRHSEEYSPDCLQIILPTNSLPLFAIQSIHTKYCHTLSEHAVNDTQELCKANTDNNMSLKDILPLISRAGTKSANTCHLSVQEQALILATLDGTIPYKTVSLGTGKGGRTTLDSVDRQTAIAAEKAQAEILAKAIKEKMIAEAQERENAKFEAKNKVKAS